MKKFISIILFFMSTSCLSSTSFRQLSEPESVTITPDNAHIYSIRVYASLDERHSHLLIKIKPELEKYENIGAFVNVLEHYTYGSNDELSVIELSYNGAGCQTQNNVWMFSLELDDKYLQRTVVGISLIPTKSFQSLGGNPKRLVIDIREFVKWVRTDGNKKKSWVSGVGPDLEKNLRDAFSPSFDCLK